MTEHVETFRSSLRGAATLHETEAADATETLADVVEPPAVGVSLSLVGVALPDAVETEFSPADIENAQTGVTPARHAIAAYGTVTLPSEEALELVSLYAERHVAVVAASAVVPDMKTAYERLDADIGGGQENANADAEGAETDDAAAEDAEADDPAARTQVLATGPSATADMGTLVEGVHGPDEVHVVLVTDR
jgi:L-lactate dehydrogenase complex protein LldG